MLNTRVFILIPAQNCVDINIETENHSTPLMLAADMGHWSVVERLVGLGAVLNATDDKGNTPLHLVVSSAKSFPVESTELKQVLLYYV